MVRRSGHPGQIAVSHASSIRRRNADATETLTLPVLTSRLEEVARMLIPSPDFAEATGGRCPNYDDGGDLRGAYLNYRVRRSTAQRAREGRGGPM